MPTLIKARKRLCETALMTGGVQMRDSHNLQTFAKQCKNLKLENTLGDKNASKKFEVEKYP